MYKLCKTEQSAARQRELERSLASLMIIRRYEEITVSDFCVHAGIPRKAFYRYFSSKDDALYALLDHTMLEFEFFSDPYILGAPQTQQRNLERFFRFWKEQKLLLDALENSGLSGVLMERAISNVSHDAQSRRHRRKLDAKVCDYVIRFTICGIMTMVINWHHCGYQESIQEMAQITLRLVNEPLIPMLQEIF